MKSNKVLTAFLLSFFLVALGSFGLRLRWVFIIMMVAVAFAFLIIGRSLGIHLDYYKKNWLVMITASFILMLLPNARHDNVIYNEMIYLFVCTFAVITCTTNRREFGKVEKYIICVGMTLAVYLVFVRVFSSLYLNYLVPHLGTETRERVIDGWRFGYGAAVGNSYTFADNVIMMAVALTVADDIIEGGKTKNKILLLTMFAGILLEGRKGELVSGLIAVLAIYYIHANHRKIRNPVRKIVFFVIGAAAIALIIMELGKRGYLVRFQQLFERFSSSRSGEETDYTSGRFELWRYAFDLFLKHPILGAGWGRFANYTTGVYADVYEGQTIMDVHNVLLQLLCETGIVGTAIIVIPLLNIIRKTFQHAKKNKTSGFICQEESKISIFALTLFIYFLILSFMDPVLTNQNFWCVFAVAVILESFSTKLDFDVLGGIQIYANR